MDVACLAVGGLAIASTRTGPACAAGSLPTWPGLGHERCAGRLSRAPCKNLGALGPAAGRAAISNRVDGRPLGEATLRLLGLGPGPQHDSLGLLLNEELPRLSTDATALGIASLVVVLALALLSARNLKEPT